MANPALAKLPVQLQVARELQTALAAISTANAEYGFLHDVKKVYRSMRDPRAMPAANFPYICNIGGRRRYSTGDDGASMNFYDCHARFIAWGYIDKVGKDDDADWDPESVCEAFIATIQAALLLPLELWGGSGVSVVDHLTLKDADWTMHALDRPVGIVQVGYEVLYPIRASVVPSATPAIDGPYQGRS